MRDFRTLAVWKAAHAVTLDVYAVTASFPSEERYELARQLRRCAASVGANIAEGCGRGSQRDFRRFLAIALGSASELEYHLLLAYDLRILGAADHARLDRATVSCKRMLAGLMAKIAIGANAAE